MNEAFYKNVLSCLKYITFFQPAFTCSMPTMEIPKNVWNMFNSYKRDHCVKSVQVRSYFWSVFSCIWAVHFLRSGRQWYNEDLFLLLSYVLLDYDFVYVILSILNLYLCYFILFFQWIFFSLIKRINRLISKGIPTICLKVTIEKKVTFSKIRFSNLSPDQFLKSSNSRRYHWILKILVAA